VRLGAYNINHPTDQIRVIETIAHPQYSNSTYANDIALVKLERSVIFNRILECFFLSDFPTLNCTHPQLIFNQYAFTWTQHWANKYAIIMPLDGEEQEMPSKAIYFKEFLLIEPTQ